MATQEPVQEAILQECMKTLEQHAEPGFMPDLVAKRDNFLGVAKDLFTEMMDPQDVAYLDAMKITGVREMVFPLMVMHRGWGEKLRGYRSKPKPDRRDLLIALVNRLLGRELVAKSDLDDIPELPFEKFMRYALYFDDAGMKITKLIAAHPPVGCEVQVTVNRQEEAEEEGPAKEESDDDEEGVAV